MINRRPETGDLSDMEDQRRHADDHEKSTTDPRTNFTSNWAYFKAIRIF